VKKHIFALILFFVLTGSLLTVFANSSTAFTVPPLSQKTVNVNLNQGDSVNGTFSVTGGTGTGVDFIVTDPKGKELLSSNFTSAQSFSFSAKINGTYMMSFDNSFCSCEGGKNVTLEYSVSNSGGASVEDASSEGLPVISALVLTVAIAAVAVVAVVFLIRRPKANSESAKVPSVQKVG
jgi:hypothetical protein